MFYSVQLTEFTEHWEPVIVISQIIFKKF
jgi:hypothetical protein